MLEKLDLLATEAASDDLCDLDFLEEGTLRYMAASRSRARCMSTSWAECLLSWVWVGK